MNQCICHEFTNSQFWIHLNLLSQRLLDYLIARQEVIDILDYAFESTCISSLARLLFHSAQPVEPVVNDNPYCFSLEMVELLNILCEENSSKIGNYKVSARW